MLFLNFVASNDEAMPDEKLTRQKDRAHDAVFKAFFSDATIARNYLLHYSPPAVYGQIDFSLFRKNDTAFVSGRFGLSFSDVLYETRLTTGAPARLLFLFEHKSYLPNFPIHLQLLDYLLQIWEDDLKNGRPLSVIIPIVVYHGEKGWEQKTFSDFFPDLPEDWRVFVPNFHYLLTDLSRVPPLEIQNKRESEYVRNLFLALKFARNKDLIVKNWKKIFTFGVPYFHDDRDKILFQTLRFYIVNLHKMQNIEINALNEQLPDPERDWMDSIPEIFGEKWKRAGVRKGRKIEREENNRTFTLKTLQKFPDWSDAEVAEFVGVTVEYVQQMRRELAKGK
ncbi:MAG: Rpn family recombination-promoting nuclease/putative transposase [Thermoanaerobaculia bacterium]|nr:Rpn family recombination-promoting nuclease/putative transposase [Thermoanaerobaculia bacterium]